MDEAVDKEDDMNRPHSGVRGVTSVVELRRYRLHPGARERLIDLFDREFIETQEDVGMTVIGQFRDLDDPDSFVWLRGFSDMPARAQALAAFYDGPVWAKHRDAANGTMVNSDNVLLLRPAFPDAGFALLEQRPDPHAPPRPPGLVIATICYLAPQTEEPFARLFAELLAPRLAAASATILASFVTERSPNSFPRLPVREGETVFVWFAGFESVTAYEEHLAALDRSEAWIREAMPAMDRRTWRRNEVSRLVPTARSLLRVRDSRRCHISDKPD
jgi:quinol monooxygenase YgiN